MSNYATQPVDEISASSKELEEWVVNIEARLDNQQDLELSHPATQLQTSMRTELSPSIYCNWQCWDFGASFLSETKKWEFVAYMKRWCDLNVRSYLEYMQEKEDLAWSYYHEVDEQFRAENSKRFIEYLLCNSCFLIFAMVILTKEKRLLKILGQEFTKRSTDFDILMVFIGREGLTRTQHYMLAMDYQIPWFVVEAVYTKHSKLSNLADSTPIENLALSCCKDLYPIRHKSEVRLDPTNLPPRGFKHLLHIFHWSRTPEGKFKTVNVGPNMKMDKFYIPSATDLRLSQTVFQKHTGGSIHVSYYHTRFSGVMKLAPWHIFEYNTKICESLLKYERECGMVYGYHFTAYVACMVCLLQTQADVRLFRAKGIISSTRNGEKDVLDYVQKFKTLLNDDVPMSDDLYNLAHKVMACHKKRSSRCYGEFKNRYCANPWITISVIAGILLFVLTFIQAVYGALSYYKQ